MYMYTVFTHEMVAQIYIVSTNVYIHFMLKLYSSCHSSPSIPLNQYTGTCTNVHVD